MNNYPIKSALVLGSTSEIGQSMIFELAKNGCKRFHLVARDEKENEKLAKNLKNNFPKVFIFQILGINNFFLKLLSSIIFKKI